jgi:hypothetical protein
MAAQSPARRTAGRGAGRGSLQLGAGDALPTRVGAALPPPSSTTPRNRQHRLALAPSFRAGARRSRTGWTGAPTLPRPSARSAQRSTPITASFAGTMMG